MRSRSLKHARFRNAAAALFGWGVQAIRFDFVAKCVGGNLCLQPLVVSQSPNILRWDLGRLGGEVKIHRKQNSFYWRLLKLMMEDGLSCGAESWCHRSLIGLMWLLYGWSNESRKWKGSPGSGLRSRWCCLIIVFDYFYALLPSISFRTHLSSCAVLYMFHNLLVVRRLTATSYCRLFYFTVGEIEVSHCNGASPACLVPASSMVRGIRRKGMDRHTHTLSIPTLFKKRGHRFFLLSFFNFLRHALTPAVLIFF